MAAKLVTWKKEQPISDDDFREEYNSPDDRVRQNKAKRKEKIKNRLILWRLKKNTKYI